MKGIEHVGIAVYSIEEALPLYTEVFGFTYITTEIVQSELVKVAFIEAGNVKIELLEPINEQSPISKFLEKKGPGIHHIALKTEKIDSDIKKFQDNGLEMIHKQAKRGAGGAQVAFIHPKSTNKVLFELCEKKLDDE